MILVHQQKMDLATMPNNVLLTHNKFSKLFTLSPLFLALSPQLLAEEVVSIVKEQSIEKIVVTAQKRTENIQEVPISITAIEPTKIENVGFKQLNEIAEFIPNMRMTTTNDSGSVISLRGVGAASRNIGFDSRVGLYLDGVYLGQSLANNQDIFDLERIEVLRGPQGTLFGKNNVAGAVHLISKKPTDEFFGRVGLGVGNYDLQQVNAIINSPLSDNIFAKLSVNSFKRDGLTENIVTGNWLNEQDNQSFRLQLSGDISHSLSFHFSVDQLTSERLSFDGEPITDTLGLLRNTEAPERRKVSFDIDPYEERELGGEILTLDWQLANGFILKSITGHRESNIEFVNDFDFSNAEVAAFNYLDDYDQYSQELQLISPIGKFQYVAGVYYYQQDAYTKRQPKVLDDAITLFTGVERSLIEYGASLGDPQSQGLLTAFYPGVLNTEGRVDTSNLAVFFNSNYQLNNKFTLDLGFRYSDEKKAIDWQISSIEAETGRPIIPALKLANGSVKDTSRYHDFSPLVSLKYQVNDDVHSYIKYASGYKSGGYNADFLTQDQLDAGIAFDKETVETYEIGLKGYAFEQSLMFSSALFYSQYDDFQVNQLVKLSSGTTALSIRNAAEVTTKGLELEAIYYTDSFEYFAAIGLLDGKFDKFKNGGLNGEDLSGSPLPEVSDYTFNLGVNYFRQLSSINSELTLSMNYHYIDDYSSDLDGTSEINLADGDVLKVGEISGYGIANASITISPLNSGFTFSLWAKNIADEDSPVLLGRKSFFGARRNVYVEPKMYGLTAQYNF
ncbi:TonB-dependent receptor [Thalassotalea agariperforans]